MTQILIFVTKFDLNGKNQFKVLYQNSIEWNNDVCFDFSSLFATLRLLYPKSDFIEFKLSTK